MDSTVRSRGTFLPIVAGLVGLVVGGLAVGYATGYFRARPGVPALELQRDDGVEWLFPGREAVYVFRFRGGVPKCSAYVERPTGPETLSLDAKPAVVQGPTPRSPPDEVEGLVALVGPPAGKEGTYTLHIVITKLTFPEGRRPLGAASTATYWTEPKAGGPKPPESAGSNTPPLSHRQSPDLQPGQDVVLVSGPVSARGGNVRAKMWLRFYTPEELATSEPQQGGE